MSRHLKSISASRLIVVEGLTDQSVFEAIFKAHNLADMQAFAAVVPGRGGGWSFFGEFLSILETSPGFEKVKLIVMVGDSDTNQSFKNVANEIHSAHYSRPKAVQEIAHTHNKPDICILMVPLDGNGCIESLCYQAAREKWPDLIEPLQRFESEVPARAWTENKKVKMRAQCMLAATCKPKPDIAIKDHWQKGSEYSLPVDGPAFAPIAAFLKSLP
jgi:hypothetical protein